MHSHHSSDQNILIALILNLIFSISEFIGGALTNSAAITSDAVHSLADALSTGIAYVFERLSHSKKFAQKDKESKIDPAKYSLIGGLIVSGFLIFSSAHLIIEAIERIKEPAEVSYDGMMLFAVLGVIFNLLAALVTMKGESFNQKAVNLHMLEDTFSWLAVLIGAIVMKLTGVHLIDPILSIAIALYILYRAIKNLLPELKLHH